MAQIFGMSLRNAMHEPCDDLDLGIFVYVRTATLMKQIIASTFFTESRYNVQRIRELLNGIGGPDFNPEQTELFLTLENILRDVENEDLQSTLKTMVENASQEFQSINIFCWRNHSELIRGLHGVRTSVRCREEGWDPEVVMNALVVALVREIISLFRLSLNTLISFARKVCSDAFDEDTIDALRRIVTLHSSVMSAGALFMDGQAEEYIEKYEAVVLAFNFERHFTFQPDKRKLSYTTKLLVDDVPLEISYTISKLQSERSSHDECEKERLRQKITEDESTIQTLCQENDNSQDRLQQAEASNRNLTEQLDEQREQMDELREEIARAERRERITYWEKEYERLRLQNLLEFTSECTAKAKSINRTIQEQSRNAELIKTKCDEMDLYLTLTADLLRILEPQVGIAGLFDDE